MLRKLSPIVAVAAILSILVGVAPAHAQQLGQYTSVVSVTSGGQTVAFAGGATRATEVVVNNTGPSTIYVSITAAATSSDTASVALATCTAGIWTSLPTAPIKQVWLATSSGQTATANVMAFALTNYQLQTVGNASEPNFQLVSTCYTGQANQAILGATTIPSASSAPSATIFEGQPASGSNTAGANFTLAVGPSTGTGASGSLIGQTSAPAASGSTANTLVNAFSFNGLNFTIGPLAQVSGGAVAANSSIAGTNGTGTNQGGGNLTLLGGLGTGTGTAGALIGQVGPAVATGTTQATAATVFNFGGQSFTIGGWAQASGGAAASASTIFGVSGTGTNQIGGNLTLGPGAGTGNAAAASAGIQRDIMGASGTSAQSQADAVRYCASKTLSNTSATLTTLATIALPSNSAGAVEYVAAVTCTDGTNFDSDLLKCEQAYVNKAGAITLGTHQCTSSVGANNSGSCTVAPTETSGSSLINLNVTPVIGTIVPTTTTGMIAVINAGGGNVTCQ